MLQDEKSESIIWEVMMQSSLLRKNPQTSKKPKQMNKNKWKKPNKTTTKNLNKQKNPKKHINWRRRETGEGGRNIRFQMAH